MSNKEYPFGKIVHHEREDSSFKEIVRITGLSNTSPSFINNIDENLWDDYWETQGKNLGIKYVHTQDRFDKDPVGIGSYFFKDEIDSVSKTMENLLESYNNSAKAYNERIAKFFINQRKEMLEGILQRPKNCSIITGDL